MELQKLFKEEQAQGASDTSEEGQVQGSSDTSGGPPIDHESISGDGEMERVGGAAPSTHQIRDRTSWAKFVARLSSPDERTSILLDDGDDESDIDDDIDDEADDGVDEDDLWFDRHYQHQQGTQRAS